MENKVSSNRYIMNEYLFVFKWSFSFQDINYLEMTAP